VEPIKVACVHAACLNITVADTSCLNIAGVDVACFRASSLSISTPNTASAKSSGSGINGKGELRRDRNMNPINTDYDLYSMGKDGETSTQVHSQKGKDDIIRALNGEYVGLGADF
jgi:hypothetical protein